MQPLENNGCTTYMHEKLITKTSSECRFSKISQSIILQIIIQTFDSNAVDEIIELYRNLQHL